MREAPTPLGSLWGGHRPHFIMGNLKQQINSARTHYSMESPRPSIPAPWEPCYGCNNKKLLEQIINYDVIRIYFTTYYTKTMYINIHKNDNCKIYDAFCHDCAGDALEYIKNKIEEESQNDVMLTYKIHEKMGYEIVIELQ
jgi:hypothetical protein